MREQLREVHRRAQMHTAFARRDERDVLSTDDGDALSLPAVAHRNIVVVRNPALGRGCVKAWSPRGTARQDRNFRWRGNLIISSSAYIGQVREDAAFIPASVNRSLQSTPTFSVSVFSELGFRLDVPFGAERARLTRGLSGER